MKRNRKNAVFKTNDKTDSIAPNAPIEVSVKSGISQPPKKRVTVKAAAVTILAYSAVKNIANFILLYSV
tara:strand:- start:9 stop:215 length:207 start_codon:yes stop_codon:yes gene_type:complete